MSKGDFDGRVTCELENRAEDVIDGDGRKQVVLAQGPVNFMPFHYEDGRPGWVRIQVDAGAEIRKERVKALHSDNDVIGDRA